MRDKNIKYKNKNTQKDHVLPRYVFSMCTELSCVTLDVDMGSRIEGRFSVSKILKRCKNVKCKLC